MSEEEIIKYIKDEIENETDTYHWFDNMPNNETRKQIEESINAHQGLLDLYNKKKAKIKELENADLTTVYMNGFYDGEKKWKDKIKNKFEDYSQIKSLVQDWLFNTLRLNNEVEIIEESEQEIDIQAIKELLTIEDYEFDKTDGKLNRDKINELVQAVKKLDNKIKEK